MIGVTVAGPLAGQGHVKGALCHAQSLPQPIKLDEHPHVKVYIPTGKQARRREVTMKRLSVGGVFGVAVVAFAVGLTWAGDISPYANGPWLGFAFFSPGTSAKGCQPADPNGGACSLGENSVPADAPPWIFSVGPAGATLEVVDVFSTGDVFEVFNYGASLGTTSAAPTGGFCGPNPDGCVGTSASYGIFQLAPGDYSITIKAVVSPFNIGLAYFRIDGDVVGSPPPPPPDSDGDGLADSVDACPTSALAPTVVITGCNSGVENPLFDDGCTLTDRVLECGNGSKNHGVVASCSSQLLEELKVQGQITGKEKDAIQRCVARTK
jgi:hypothetical protein